MSTAIKGQCRVAAVVVALSVGLPATANAEYFVPPGNSAATQYTEAYPTARGHRDAENGLKGSDRSPSQALGADNARQLESQGQAGREAAEFAAETAPSGPAGGAAGDGGSAPADTGQGKEAKRAGGEPSQSQAGERSSGIGEVLAQATGFSSGEMGLLLPAIIIGAIAAGLAFLRWRKSPTA